MALVAPPPTEQQSKLHPPLVNQIGQWFWHNLLDEGQSIGRALKSPASYILLLLTLAGLGLAWQSGFSYRLDPQQDTLLDEPFYHGFNNVEFLKNGNKLDLTPDGRVKPYRWTTGDAYWLFPAVGQNSYEVKLTLAGSANPQPDFVVLANGQRIGAGRAEAGIKIYVYMVPRQLTNNDGDLKIELQTKTFKDPRELGLVFFGGQISATGHNLNLPPLNQLGWLTAVIMLLYLLLSRAGFGGWWAGSGATLILATLVWAIINGARPWLTIFSPALVYAVGLSWLLLIIADWIMREFWADQTARRWVLTVLALSFAVKLAGILHPQAVVEDIGFHIHQLDVLWQQGVLFNKIQSAEFGGRYTIYPPTPYVFIGLFRWLIPDERLLLETFMVALDSSRVLLIYILAQKTLNNRLAAILAAFFMAVMPVDVLSIAWGQVSNLFGEWLLLATLTLVVIKWEQLRRPLYFGLATLLLTLAFISHPGVILLAGTVFLLIGIFLARRKGNRTFVLIYVLALALSFGLYHIQVIGDMIPQALETVQTKLSSPSNNKNSPPNYQVGGSVRDNRLSQQYGLTQKIVHSRSAWLLEGLAGFWAEARVYFGVLPLAVAPWFLWWLWHTSRAPDQKAHRLRRRLFWASVAWFSTAGLFAGIGLTINLYVRYSLFLLPVVALAMAVFLAHLNTRLGWWGKLLSGVVVVYFLVTSLALYYDRIIYANR